MSAASESIGGLDAERARWDEVRVEFEQGHRTRLNCAIHLLTTPLGLFALLGLMARLDPVVPVIATEVYLLAIRRRVPAGVWWANALVFAVLVVAAVSLDLPIAILLASMSIAWLGQDLAHRLTGEAPYADRYRGLRSAYLLWAEHCLLLMPLVLVAARHSKGSLLGWLVPRVTVRKAHFTSPHALEALATLERWILSHDVPRDRTTHWWQHELDDEEGAYGAMAEVVRSDEIERLLRGQHGERAVVIPVPEMNEVYVTGPAGTLSSDRVFYRSHVDGPFAVFPGVVLYRCMVGINRNERIRTVFDLERTAAGDFGVVLDAGEVLAFDYHRSPHRIEPVASGVEQAASETNEAVLRMNLKLHYAVAPAWLAPWARLLARLSARYNTSARRLFLRTLRPRTMRDRWTARAVVAQTVTWDWIARSVGHRNLLHLTALLVASAISGSLLPLVLGGSFVHYLLYIATFASRRDVSFGVFRRDAVFHKTLSTTILGGLYATCFELDPVSLALVVLGFGTAAFAAARLGLDRTYFGQELGLVPRRLEARLPYSLLPHPMILGSIVGLVGIHLMDPFRSAWPWLVPTHVLFYLVHLAQEVYDVHERDADPGPGRAVVAPRVG
ncbi:MAG: hypothetical protein R3F16_15855 [Myxococcota bacterium]